MPLALILTLVAAIASFGLMFWLGTGQHGPRMSSTVLIRLVVVFVPTAAAFYSVFWVGGALVSSIDTWPPVAVIAALLAAAVVTYYLCLRTSSFPPGLVGSLLVGAFVAGGLAFLLGFFGPLLLAPASLHAPLLGIFVTGPIGFVLGAIAGAIYWFRHRPSAATRPSQSAG